MPFILPRMPGILLHVERPALPLQQTALGGSERILKEHPKPLPRYKRCGSQVPAGRISNCHYKSKKCKQVIVPDQFLDPTIVGGVPVLGADDCLQQQQLGGVIPQPAQISAAVGDDSNYSRKDSSNGAVLGINVQGGGPVDATL